MNGADEKGALKPKQLSEQPASTGLRRRGWLSKGSPSKSCLSKLKSNAAGARADNRLSLSFAHSCPGGSDIPIGKPFNWGEQLATVTH
jgi:hypothetical protein